MTGNRNIVSKLGRIASTPRLPRYEIPFTLPGPLTIVLISPPWRPRVDVNLTAVRAYLTLAGDGPTVVTVNVNGTPVDLLNAAGVAVTNVTFPAAVTALAFAGHTAIGPSDTLTVTLVSFTAPATGLTVIVDMG